MRHLFFLAVICFTTPLFADPIELNDQPFAVVELFTSEGCSSCPPADIVASDLLREAAEDDKPVYVLAFHVDYWNRLGWTDRFSSPDYSLRQRHYTRTLGLRSSYTPQMIVNGRSQFVGSHRTKADREIATALEKPVTLPLGIRVDQGDTNDQLKISWRIDRIVDQTNLHIAIVEDGLATRVKTLAEPCNTMASFVLFIPLPSTPSKAAWPSQFLMRWQGRTPR